MKKLVDLNHIQSMVNSVFAHYLLRIAIFGFALISTESCTSYLKVRCMNSGQSWVTVPFESESTCEWLKANIHVDSLSWDSLVIRYKVDSLKNLGHCIHPLIIPNSIIFAQKMDTIEIAQKCPLILNDNLPFQHLFLEVSFDAKVEDFRSNVRSAKMKDSMVYIKIHSHSKGKARFFRIILDQNKL
jgi:hypothetical protein